MKNKYFILNHLFISLLILNLIFFTAGYIFYSHYRTNFSISFGAEYGAIAQTMMEGKGYSNPFYFESGPTAWMLPVLVYLIYFVISVFGNGYPGFFMLTGIKLLCYVMALYMAIKFLKIEKDIVHLILFLLLFFLYFIFSPYENFGMIIDLWLIVFMEMSFLYAFVFYHQTRHTRYFIYLLGVLFLIPLLSPGFALASATIILLYVLNAIRNRFKNLPETSAFSAYILALYSRKSGQQSLLPFVLMGLSFMLSITLWSYRNYRTFNEFIALKSNMPFEFYMSNVLDHNGQLSNSTVELVHPNRNTGRVAEILSMGEIQWIKQYKVWNREYLRYNKKDFMVKMLNRIFNAFIFIHHDVDNLPLGESVSLTQKDYKLLESMDLIHNGEWMCLTLTEKEFETIVRNGNFNNTGEILRYFSDARNSFLHRIYSLPNLFRSLMMSLVPTICLIFLCCREKVRRSIEYQAVALSYILYISLYILVSHQLRYQKPLFLLQVMLIIMAIREIRRMSTPAVSGTGVQG